MGASNRFTYKLIQPIWIAPYPILGFSKCLARREAHTLFDQDSKFFWVVIIGILQTSMPLPWPSAISMYCDRIPMK